MSRLSLESEKRIDGVWSMDLIDSGLLLKMSEAIVVFEIYLKKIEGKWKMSQNRKIEDAWSAACGLDSMGGEDNLKIAAEIRTINGKIKNKNV